MSTAHKSAGTLTMSTIPKPPPLNKTQKAQISKMIKMKEEVKFVDLVSSQAIAQALATTLILSTVPQGTGQSQRLGNQIRILGFKINWDITCADTTNIVRVIFWTYKSNSVNFAPSVAVVLNIGPAATQDVTSQYNFQNRKDYKIHHDKTFMLSTAANPQERHSVRVNIPEKYQIVDYISDVNSSGSVNPLCLTYLSDSAAASHPTINGTVRLFYQDA